MKKTGWINKKSELERKMRANLKEYDRVAATGSEDEETMTILETLSVQYEGYAKAYEEEAHGDIDAFEERLLSEIAEKNQKASNKSFNSKHDKVAALAAA